MKISLISLLLIASTPLLAQNSIKIDGLFDDWNGGMATYVDDSFDSQAIELLRFSVCNDEENLYVKIKFGEEVDLTEESFNPAELIINIDADNDISTGFQVNNIGSEYGINFLDKLIYDDTNNNPVSSSLYELGVIPLPTYTSDEFEIAIDRELFSNTISISIKESIGNDFMPDNGDVFTYTFDDCSEFDNPNTDFSKNDSLHLRLMTYNVLNNGLIGNNSDRFERIVQSVMPDIITFNECGNTSTNDIEDFLTSIGINNSYIYNYSTGNITVSKYPSIQSWQVENKINAELIDLPDNMYSTDILIINGHLKCCGNNQGRQQQADVLIEFITDAKSPGGVIDLPVNTPISFSGDMNLVGYSEQYFTIVNGTVSDTINYGNGGFPDWDNSPFTDQISFQHDRNVAATWRDISNNTFPGDFPPGRLDFIFFTNSVMSVDKSFIISTENMTPSSLEENNLNWNDSRASDHLPVIADYVIPQASLPQASFSISSFELCTDEEVSFVDFSSGQPTEWLWDFGDETTSTEQNPTHTYTTAGTFSITLSVTNESGSNSSTQNMVLYASPAIQISINDEDNVVCIDNGSVEISADQAGTVFSGLGVEDSLFNPEIAGVGTHIITGTFTDGNGCVGTDTQEVLVELCFSISEYGHDNISLYPNPSDGVFYINGVADGTSIEILNLNGQTVFESIIKNRTQELDLSFLSNGVYILQARINNMLCRQRFIKY